MEQTVRQGPVRRRSVVLGAAALGLGAMAWRRSPWAATGPLRHEAYVWQRVWGPAVQRAVARAADDFTALTVLGAEVSGAPGEPVTDVRFAGDALRQSALPVTLAVRVQTPTSGASEPDDEVVRGAITRMLRRADEQGIAVGEVQLDVDRPSGQLDAYRSWLGRLRGVIGARALTATTLPAWLHRPAFVSLAAELDGYVLQVHGLERPAPGRASLFDRAAALRAVAMAGALGRPFRLALPTYRYEVAFDASGGAVGVSAEGPARTWRPEQRVERTGARPADVAALVGALTEARPGALRGLVWYRLPVDGDEHNWARPTLRAVQAGREPQARLTARMVPEPTGAWSVVLRNDGDDGSSYGNTILVSWPPSARRVASDALGGASEEHEGSGVTLRPGRPLELRPGQECAVGWVRLAGEGAPVVRLGQDGVPA